MQDITIPTETRPISEEEQVALGFPKTRGMLDLDVYTIEDLAERLDLTTITIRNHIKSGRLVAIKFGGATGFRILRQHIYEWLINMQTNLNEPSSSRGTGQDITNGTK